MSDQVLSRRALNRATLARQLLLRRSSMTAATAVEHLVGLQAQAPFSPYYQLWSRLDRFDPDELARLLVNREVARIVVMRGTIHLMSAADCLTFRPLTQPLMTSDLRTNTQHAAGIRGLDLAEFVQVARAVLEETPRTVSELGTVLAERYPHHEPGALAHAARGLLALVQIPPRAVWGMSGQPRLTTAQSWLGGELDPEPSIDAMVLRYLAAFGPASVADVQTWCGLTRLREVVERLRPRLRTFRAENGKELFDLPDAPHPDPETPAPPRFLPDFDNVIRSHADRSRVIDDDARKRMTTRNGVTPHALLVDGVVSGKWRVARTNGSAALHVELFRPLATDDLTSVEAEAHRLLSFAEADADAHEVEFTKA
ncbi:winged helix DNA-binding domain-containing protein [Phytoactinopolyspora mesophila]|uniref:Winged helix DNA-binding domain-containing protein n=1 Tax=Phytoactinopolyspora mesophila TaxID=2650750 RepID=A0A7K3M4R6_9ACTN|nr:winged helix DNA-binding domain-containing protein [Phytoactinopolyspora mesophila]NDL58311.1 winged helix DNA-binding domain-containing protein [Phytoactinopolyspora mesophila]